MENPCLFGVLPTTFNKLLDRSRKSIAVVVTPLAVLMQELRNKFVPRVSNKFVSMQEYRHSNQSDNGGETPACVLQSGESTGNLLDK